MFLWCKIMKCILYITLCCLWYLLYQEELRLHLYLRGQSTIQNMTKMLQKIQYSSGLEQYTSMKNFLSRKFCTTSRNLNLKSNAKSHIEFQIEPSCYESMYRTINHTFWRKRWSILSTVYERSYVFSAARLGFRIWHYMARACMYHRSIAWSYLGLVHDFQGKTLCWSCRNVPTTPITAMGCRQCLSLSDVQLKGKHCRKPHCRNGVVDTFGPCQLEGSLKVHSIKCTKLF